MYQIASVYKNRNKNLKVEFNLLDIYRILKNELGFKYIKIKEKGYYLQEINGRYEIVKFYQLKDVFKEYITRYFHTQSISNEIDFHLFLNEFYRQSPIKNSNYARQILSEGFELSELRLITKKN